MLTNCVDECSVVGDTCVAMGEWVQHPQAHTALDDILPCVDTAAAMEALNRSKEVNYELVTVLNGALANVSNRDIPPQLGPPFYYNQSGPPVPLLCNPYTPDLKDRTCAPGEVTVDAAQQVTQMAHRFHSDGDTRVTRSGARCRHGRATCAGPRSTPRRGGRCALPPGA
jgi:hypothetical protein